MFSQFHASKNPLAGGRSTGVLLVNLSEHSFPCLAINGNQHFSILSFKCKKSI